MEQFAFDRLRRWPDIEAPNLFASDASDRLILDEASELLDTLQGRDVVVVGDRYGALTLGAAAAHGLSGIRVHQDAYTGELALAANAERFGLAGSFDSHPLDASLVSGARVVLLQLPRSLAELDEVTDLIARHADDDVVVFAGGRIKHLTLAMNDVLGRSFAEVSATRARQKSRVLIARGLARPADAPRYPRVDENAELGLTVVAYGGAFSGTTLDIGTRFLLSFLDQIVPPQATAPPSAAVGQPAPARLTAIDLGCGTGILAAALARQNPDWNVIASDTSAAAVASARGTVAANGVDDRVSVVRDNLLSKQPDDSADVIVCNPPFHVGSSVHTGVALEMFRDAARVLRPGGRLFTVFNSHLAYQADLRRLVGPTRELGRNTKFVVTESVPR
ncbi:class I SAM-dependent methyltransferase [Subtercola endophyticus]|uniref:class I SAM-dependent methyltransferase n=1 Tax=Subtercola endophyticus TaxID=2895559 RepID=UPI001E5BF160|nr:class I SAM-dependent methyltransferase [Subtercola endophyticus]UFS60190.1 methyltransferase [Subtercola endophyticus]